MRAATVYAKTTSSIKSSAEKIADVTSNVAPRYKTPPTWLSGVRVLLAFYAPLLLGLAIGNPLLLLPVSVGATIISFVDPLGSNAKRFAVLIASTIGCTLSFGIGQYAGLNPVTSVLFIFALVSIGSLSGAMGSAAMRGGSWIITTGLYGVSTAGINPGYFTVYGMLLGGAWALFLALVPFRNQGNSLRDALHPQTLALRGVETHIADFLRDLPRHLTGKTAIGRSALRIAVAASLALCVSYVLDRPSHIWIAAAAVAVLNPQVRLFRERGARLVLATVLGAAAAIGLVLLAPNATILFVIVAPVLFFAANLRTVNYAMWVMLYSAFALALIFVSSGSTESTSLIATFDAKLIDTLIGVGIALIVAWVSLPQTERDELDLELTEARLGIARSVAMYAIEQSEIDQCKEIQDERCQAESSSAAATPAAKVDSKNAGSSS